MELINQTLSAMHLPGLTFLETVGAGAAMYFGVVLAKVAIGLGGQLISRLQSASRQPARGRR